MTDFTELDGFARDSVPHRVDDRDRTSETDLLTEPKRAEPRNPRGATIVGVAVSRPELAFGALRMGMARLNWRRRNH